MLATMEGAMAGRRWISGPRGGLIALAAAWLLAPAPALAWGPEGHTVIARVATEALSAAARKDLRWIVSVGVPALNAKIAQTYGQKCQIDPADPWGPVPDYRGDDDQHTNLPNWADCYRYLDATTAGWHFNDIPLAQTPSGPLDPGDQPWCAAPKGCASTALADNLRALAGPDPSPADAARALAFVVHLVGDIHQPLHEEDNDDVGGNSVLIVPVGVSALNLHELWDVALVEMALGVDLETATGALRRSVREKPEVRYGSLDQAMAASDAWVDGAHALAQPAYAMLNLAKPGAAKGVVVPYAYVRREAAVAEDQLALAALRLRAVLDAALTWSPPPS
jgi:hypothetical protein